MRIDIDEQLEKQLDEIKKTKWISGKGHTETVRYMAQRFQEYESLEALINRRLLHLDETIQSSIMVAFKKIINNLLQ